MKEKLSAGDIIQQLAERAGITKKLAAEVLRAIPEIVEEALNTDGEARVRGLGTFRLKTVASKKGRNPKTGEEVVIPPHQKLVFLPEESFRDQANEEFRFLGIKVLEEEVSGQQSPVSGQESGTWNSGTLESDPVSGQQDKPVAPATALYPDSEPGTRNLEPDPVSGQSLTSPDSPPSPLFPVSESERGPGGEADTATKRQTWLIPTLIGIVAILSVVFYFRNCSSVRGPQSEQAPEKPVATTQEEATAVDSGAAGGQDYEPVAPATASYPDSEPETGNPESDSVSGQQSAVSGQDSGTWNAGTLEPNKQVPELKPQNLNLNTDLPTTHIGTHLYQLAREVYGNPFLWVLIYRSNLDKIKNPDQVVYGNELTIPALEGTPKKLTHNDSLNVSDGYRLVYEYYLQHGDSRAEEFRLVMLKYKPKYTL